MKTLMIGVAAALFGGLAWAGDKGDRAAAPEARPIAAITAACVACHGQDGNAADGPHQAMNPRLAGQYADFLAKSLREYKSGVRKNPIMMGMAAGLSEADIDRVAKHYAAQPGKLITPPAD